MDQYDRRQGRVRHPLGSHCMQSVFALHSVLLAEALDASMSDNSAAGRSFRRIGPIQTAIEIE